MKFLNALFACIVLLGVADAIYYGLADTEWSSMIPLFIFWCGMLYQLYLNRVMK